MKKLILTVLLALVALTSAGIVAAQDDTPGFDTNTPITPVGTISPAEDAPVAVVTDEPSSPVGEESLPEGEIRLTWGQIILGVLGAIGAGLVLGAGAVLTTFSAIVKNIKNDAPLLNAIEKLYLSQPLETREQQRKGVEILKDAAEIADRVTDGKPNSPAASPA